MTISTSTGFQPRFHKPPPNFQRFLKHQREQNSMMKKKIYGQKASGFMAIHQQSLKNKMRDEAEEHRIKVAKDTKVESQLRHDQRTLLDDRLLKAGLKHHEIKVKDLLSDLANPEVPKDFGSL